MSGIATHTIKRSLDIIAAVTILLSASPIVLPALLAVAFDGGAPIYRAPRIGRNGRLFHMLKLRTMVRDADKTGVESTGAHDPRITRLGHFLRRWKIDELPQLWNVVKGEMSLVGPRPNTATAIARYTGAEHDLLSVRPGITDFASVLFSNEGEILKDAPDPDEAYYRLIHPHKINLGLLYVHNTSTKLDLKLIGLTVLVVMDRARAHWIAARLAAKLSGGQLCRDGHPLPPAPPLDPSGWVS